MRIQYRKNGAIVDLYAESSKINAKITRGDKVFELDISRRVGIDNEKRYYRRMFGGGGDAIKADFVARYNVEAKIGGQTQKFPTLSFAVQHFDEWAREVPSYEANLSEGIPTKEYGSLVAAISEKNKTLGQIFEKYILDSGSLSKENNLLTSEFNNALNKFLDENER